VLETMKKKKKSNLDSPREKIYIYIYIYYEGCDVIQYFLLRIYEKGHTKNKREDRGCGG
jgi:hypothetical protein